MQEKKFFRTACVVLITFTQKKATLKQCRGKVLLSKTKDVEQEDRSVKLHGGAWSFTCVQQVAVEVRCPPMLARPFVSVLALSALICTFHYNFEGHV